MPKIDKISPTVLVFGKVNGDIGSFSHSHYQSSRLSDIAAHVHSRLRQQPGSQQAGCHCALQQDKIDVCFSFRAVTRLGSSWDNNAHTQNSDMAVTVK